MSLAETRRTFQAIDDAIKLAPSPECGLLYHYDRFANVFSLLWPPIIAGGQEKVVTEYGIRQLENEILGLEDLIGNEKGKIVFLRNGLSSIPLEEAEMYAQGRRANRPVINDVFDYNELPRDLETLIEVIEKKNKLSLPGRLHEHLLLASVLSHHIHDGSLEAVRYWIGAGSPPDSLKEASLVVNLWGPPKETLGEQLSLLAPGGRLLITTGLPVSVPEGFSVEYFDNASRVQTSALITRVA